jgi:hypothetical protein
MRKTDDRPIGCTEAAPLAVEIAQSRDQQPREQASHHHPRPPRAGAPEKIFKPLAAKPGREHRIAARFLDCRARPTIALELPQPVHEVADVMAAEGASREPARKIAQNLSPAFVRLRLSGIRRPWRATP